MSETEVINKKLTHTVRFQSKAFNSIYVFFHFLGEMK